MWLAWPRVSHAEAQTGEVTLDYGVKEASGPGAGEKAVRPGEAGQRRAWHLLGSEVTAMVLRGARTRLSPGFPSPGAESQASDGDCGSVVPENS